MSAHIRKGLDRKAVDKGVSRTLRKEQEVKVEDEGEPLPFMLLPAAISEAN